MKLSILIVNWNTRDLAVACVNSIIKNAPALSFEIIIVDNHSADGSADALTTLFGHHKNTHVLPLIRNIGFAGANNHAYANSSGEYILLLNPDTEVQGRAIEKMMARLEADQKIGVLGPRLLNPDGTTQASVRRFPGMWSSLLAFSGLHRFFRPRRYLMEDFDYGREAQVDQVMGAALLTRRSIIEQAGGLFDEKFWLWYEEVDFCLRVKRAGFAVIYYPAAGVMHRGAQSFSKLTAYERKRIAARSIKHYFRKNGNILTAVLIQIMLPLVLMAAKMLDYAGNLLRLRRKIHV